MKERPILFSTLMVQAILDGRKSMTRRMVKPQPAEETDITYMPHAPLEWESTYREIWKPWKWDTEEGESISKFCPYGQIGDILWVRETWRKIKEGYEFKADYSKTTTKWKPSIFMPKEACRIHLEITGIRVERLNDISTADCVNEGVEREWVVDAYWYKNYDCIGPANYKHDPYPSFKSLWNSINREESWNNNPWVWVIEFKKL